MKTSVFLKMMCFSENDLVHVFPNLSILLSIFLTVPVSSAECERSFSCLKRLKTWLRSTMSQPRFSFLAIIQMNRDILKKINVSELIDKFASKKTRRMEFF